MRLSSLLLLVLGFASASSLAQVGPPPTVPERAIPMATFGFIPQSNKVFPTYDTGYQFVGTHEFPSIWYHFSIGNGEAQAIEMISSFRTGSGYDAVYKLYDHSLRLIGRLDGPNVFNGGDYYVEVTAPHRTAFHFALVGIPAKSTININAGQTEATALLLGTLHKVITHSSDFFTFYKRPDVSNSTSPMPGQWAPDYSAPDPAVQRVYYNFNLTARATIKVFILNQDDDTYIIHPPGVSAGTVLKNGATVTLESGIYILEVTDKYSVVAGGGGGEIPVFRDPRQENFERHTFELLVLDGDTVAPSPGTPEVSPLGPPPTPPCVIIGNQRINC